MLRKRKNQDKKCIKLGQSHKQTKKKSKDRRVDKKLIKTKNDKEKNEHYRKI